MDKLSFEIISLIIDYLDPKRWTKLAPYSTISHTWNSVIEARTFSRIRVETYPLAHVQAFSRFFSSPRRRAALRDLEIQLCIPTHGDTRQDHQTNETYVRAALKSILRELESWQGRDKVPGGLQLGGNIRLHISSKYVLNPVLFKDKGNVNPHFDVRSSTAARRYLTLDLEDTTTQQQLPIVILVSQFSIWTYLGKRFHPTSQFQLLHCFPNLENIKLEYQDPAPKRTEMRFQHHQALAQGIASLVRHCPRLKNFSLTRVSNEHLIRNDNFARQDLTTTSTISSNSLQQDIIEDPLCSALRQLGQAGSLERLKLDNVPISPDLFRDPRDPLSAPSPWPSMQDILIDMPLFSPNGSWYFTGNAPTSPPSPSFSSPSSSISFSEAESDSEADEDSEGLSDKDTEDPYSRTDAVLNGHIPKCRWRRHPDPEIFNPLALSVAEATTMENMPRLRALGLYTVPGANLTEDHTVGLTCAVPGENLIICKRNATGRGRKKRDRWNGLAGGKERKDARRWKIWVGLGPNIPQWEVPEEIRRLAGEWVGEEGQLLGVLAGSEAEWGDHDGETDDDDEGGRSSDEVDSEGSSVLFSDFLGV